MLSLKDIKDVSHETENRKQFGNARMHALLRIGDKLIQRIFTLKSASLT